MFLLWFLFDFVYYLNFASGSDGEVRFTFLYLQFRCSVVGSWFHHSAVPECQDLTDDKRLQTITISEGILVNIDR